LGLRRPRRFLAVISAATLVAGAGWLITDRVREYRAVKLYDSNVQKMIALINLSATTDFHQRVDMVRAFINDNSRHRPDEAFDAMHGVKGAFAAALLAHAKGLTSEPVNMECSTRSNLMARILQALGYKTRIVAIFNSRTNLRSHSFLEVMNPEIERWETQDPDYDIYWQSRESKDRISLAERAETIEAIEPCGRGSCGWHHISREGIRAEKLRPYLDIISITDKERDIRYALYTSRAELDTIYTKGRKQGTFCQVEAKRCKQGFFDLKKFRSFAAELPR
jgi:hypothetical protein